MDYATYASVEATVKNDHMLAREGGPKFAMVKDLDSKAGGQITNNYLHFETIRQAALAADFTLLHIGYYINEGLLAARAEKNQGRRNFIAWAVALLVERYSVNIEQDELLRIWSALTGDERNSITTASARAFFRAVGGVKLEMAELRMCAQQELSALQAGVQVGLAPGAGAGAGGAQQSMDVYSMDVYRVWLKFQVR
jgi:hypothetical protein